MIAHPNPSDLKIVLAHKDSRFHLYTKVKPNTKIQALLEKEDVSVAQLRKAHEAHMETLTHIEAILKNRKLKYKKAYLENCTKPKGAAKSGHKPGRRRSDHDGGRIHVFSVASGAAYERLLRIMMGSAALRASRPLTFWLLRDFLSPEFAASLPDVAKALGVEAHLMESPPWPAFLTTGGGPVPASFGGGPAFKGSGDFRGGGRSDPVELREPGGCTRLHGLRNDHDPQRCLLQVPELRQHERLFVSGRVSRGIPSGS